MWVRFQNLYIKTTFAQKSVNTDFENSTFNLVSSISQEVVRPGNFPTSQPSASPLGGTGIFLCAGPPQSLFSTPYSFQP